MHARSAALQGRRTSLRYPWLSDARLRLLFVSRGVCGDLGVWQAALQLFERQFMLGGPGAVRWILPSGASPCLAISQDGHMMFAITSRLCSLWGLGWEALCVTLTDIRS